MFLKRLQNWLDRDPGSDGRRGRAARERRFRPGCELLEDRSVPATLLVNTALDVTLAGDGLVTLREAIVAANADTATDLGHAGSGADTITFDDSMSGQTIKLVQGALWITSDLVIQGPGAPLLTIDANRLSRIFELPGYNYATNIEIRGMTLTGGYGYVEVVDYGSSGDGGAIRALNYRANLTVADAIVAGNTASGSGGGIYSESGTLRVINSTVSDNTVSDGGDGGGIAASAGTLQIANSTISGNSADGRGGGVHGGGTFTNSTISGNAASYGGGVYGGDSTFTNSTISGNTAYGNGGGVDGGGTFTNCTISDNVAFSGGGVSGGGTFTGCTISGNTAAGGYGGGVDGGGTFTNCTISGNRALPYLSAGIGLWNVPVVVDGIFGGLGGGIYGEGVTVTNSTLSGNTAIFGGGLFGGGKLDNSTIAFNQAEQGAGIFVDGHDGETLTLRSTIVGSNGGPAGVIGQDITRRNYSSTVNADHSLIQNAAPGTVNGTNEANIYGADPMLAPLAANGGPTLTHALLSVSPAINKGFNPLNTAYDQRGPGFARVLRGAVDVGAYESNFDPSPVQPPTAPLGGITVTPRSGLVTTEAGGSARFSVVLTAMPLAAVTVPVSSGDTTEGVASVTSLTFTPLNWNQPQWVTVRGVDDAIIDGDVSYTIITGPATSTDPRYNGMNADDVSVTNKDDEAQPLISVSDVRKSEGSSGRTAFTFTVTLSVASYGTVAVNYATADGTAQAGSDYIATSGTLVFNPGETTKTITVWVYADSVKESDETFYLNLWGATNAVFADAQGLGTIENDDRK